VLPLQRPTANTVYGNNLPFVVCKGYDSILWAQCSVVVSIVAVLGRVNAETDLTDKWSLPGGRRFRRNIAA